MGKAEGFHAWGTQYVQAAVETMVVGVSQLFSARDQP